MRIISGKLKGKKLHTQPNSSYRPMTGRIKEAVFSVLSSGQFLDQGTNRPILEGANSIDLFGGTGAITFEAVSRGLKRAVIVEKDSASFDSLKKNIKSLGLEQQVEALLGDATSLPAAYLSCSIAFIDPPFGKNLVVPSVASLIKRKWLTDGAILIIRTNLSEKFDITEFANEIFSRKYNNSLVSIHRIQEL
jgi:16S rRNA (guanine966-N2)-methyltransferase